MKISKPLLSELSDYYKSYLKYVPEEDILNSFIIQAEETQNFLSSIPPEKESFAYAEGKWMLKEVVGHLCDTERILTYRALCFSRNDKTELPGFDENSYVPNSNYKNCTLENISSEKSAIRKAGILFFKNLNEKMFDRSGIANDVRVSVKTILFFMLAHERHHLGVIREKYLK